jgi:hypothetical protein
MDNDTNSIACLAIHLFSIIANSAATECNFSNFSNIQTKKCSLLSVAKTHKTNVVRMDIHRHHASLGLLKTCSKRKLGDDEEPACTADNAPSDTEDDDFERLAQNLINMDAADEAADAADKEEELSALPRVVVPPRAGRHTCTQIPTTSLFDFTRSNNGIDFYWQGAIKGLNAEADACEQAFVEQEGSQVPGATAASSSSSSLLC